MIKNKLYLGMLWDKSAENELKKRYPFVKIIETKGNHYALDEKKLYLVRLGEISAVMPRMAYSKEAYEAFLHLYGEK